MPDKKILALIRHQHHHIAPVEPLLDIPIVYDERWDEYVIEQVAPSLLIIMSDDNYEGFNCVRAASERGIPSLSVMDGILEWRNIWENPRYGAGGNNLARQLSLTDKIACIGPSSMRILESWGAIGKCELVGVPRFDVLFNGSYVLPSLKETEQGRILIVTAKTPSFTPQHRNEVLRGLRDLQEIINSRSDWKPIWRVTGGLDKELGIVSKAEDFSGVELHQVLREVHGVISTPSTTLLEAMAVGLPIALLDYGNRPMYQTAAWTITCRDHIESTLNGMHCRDARRMLWQEYLLRDSLAAPGQATQRFATLIREMAEIGWKRKAGEQISIPDRILPDLPGGSLAPCERFVLSDLYPEHPVFGRDAIADPLREVQALREENRALRKRLERTSLSRLFLRNVRKLLR